MVINSQDKKSIINKNIYGHFSEHLGRCIYGGLFVGEDSDIPNVKGMRSDIVEALRNIKVPVLRWPGGCFADEYHWKDGVGPKGGRKRMVNTHWGGVVEDNSFGTHEFMVLTPTYHVFDLYKNHHDAVLLGHWLDADESGIDGEKIPMLSATASEKDEIITLTMSNLSADSSAEIMCDVFGHKLGKVAGRILSGAINAKNDFNDPNVVSIKEFAGIKIEGEKLSFTMPACSVAEIIIS